MTLILSELKLLLIYSIAVLSSSFFSRSCRILHLFFWCLSYYFLVMIARFNPLTIVICIFWVAFVFPMLVSFFLVSSALCVNSWNYIIIMFLIIAYCACGSIFRFNTYLLTLLPIALNLTRSINIYLIYRGVSNITLCTSEGSNSLHS